jgi:hypothetical protein
MVVIRNPGNFKYRIKILVPTALADLAFGNEKADEFTRTDSYVVDRSAKAIFRRDHSFIEGNFKSFVFSGLHGILSGWPAGCHS